MAMVFSEKSPVGQIGKLAEQDGVFCRALHVMEVLADNGTGLGEVLRDYAEQTARQMGELAQACRQQVQGGADASVAEIIDYAPNIVSSAATVLDMTPSAMLRNHAETIGAKDKVSREEIVRVARAFRQAPEIQQMLEAAAGERLLAAQGGAGSQPVVTA